MATANSTKADRPKKPYPDFPLTPRADGRWCKRINGRVHYFRGDWQTALAEYQRVRDYLHAGKAPPISTDAVTLRDVCNEFLTLKDDLVQAGELKPRTFSDYKTTCAKLLASLGKNRLAGDLGPDDFAKLRRDLAGGVGPVTLSHEINRCRSILKFAYEHRLIDKPVAYGQSFRRPQPKTLRLEKRKKGLRLFEPHQIHSLLDAASVSMRAMILLGVNCGFGNADCGQLEFQHVNLTTGWFDYPRPKTGIDRRGKLWSETVAALEAAIAERRMPKLNEHKELIFVTNKHRASWFKDNPDSPVSKEFRKLLDATGIYRPGLSFYALRHTFETIAGDCLDQVAVNLVMGHHDNSMAANYRQRISDERLENAADHVHEWLFASGGKAR